MMRRGFLVSMPLVALLGLASVPGGAIAAAPAQSQLSSFQLQQQLQTIRGIAQQEHGIVENLSVKESAPNGVHPMASCTVSATSSIPGGTGVTVSATASTCAEAAQMVADGIKAALAASRAALG
ncbi:MAG: hypothetical protein ACREP2_05535 [Rhodanobacteraceae bacterium]